MSACWVPAPFVCAAFCAIPLILPPQLSVRPGRRSGTARPGAGGQGLLPTGADLKRLLRALGGQVMLIFPFWSNRWRQHHGGGLGCILLETAISWPCSTPARFGERHLLEKLPDGGALLMTTGIAGGLCYHSCAVFLLLPVSTLASSSPSLARKP